MTTTPRRPPAAPCDPRQIGARLEFELWREAHPDFTSQELLDNWQRIRRAWNLGPKAPKPRISP
jgi:hypothetical protein